jgi:hypothetical protein
MTWSSRSTTRSTDAAARYSQPVWARAARSQPRTVPAAGSSTTVIMKARCSRTTAARLRSPGGDTANQVGSIKGPPKPSTPFDVRGSGPKLLTRVRVGGHYGDQGPHRSHPQCDVVVTSTTARKPCKPIGTATQEPLSVGATALCVGVRLSDRIGSAQDASTAVRLIPCRDAAGPAVVAAPPDDSAQTPARWGHQRTLRNP